MCELHAAALIPALIPAVCVQQLCQYLPALVMSQSQHLQHKYVTYEGRRAGIKGLMVNPASSPCLLQIVEPKADPEMSLLTYLRRKRKLTCSASLALEVGGGGAEHLSESGCSKQACLPRVQGQMKVKGRSSQAGCWRPLILRAPEAPPGLQDSNGR